MQDTDRVELLSAWDATTIEWQCTWRFFLDVNSDSFEDVPEEVQEIADTLDRGEVYTFGGGAAPLGLLRKTND